MASPTPPPPPTQAPPPPPPSAPAPQYPSAPPAGKKTSPLVWVIAGCGGLLLLVAVVLLIAGIFVAKKVGEVAKDAGNNPAVFAAKLVAAADPNIEIVDSDSERGTVTLRNKKTGEEITLDAEDIKKGRLTFRDSEGDEVTFEATTDEGSGATRIRSKNGTVTFGATGEAPPEWVPEFPGAEPEGFYSSAGADGVAGAWSFETDDSPQKVLGFYTDELEELGFEVSSSDFRRGGQVAGGMLTAVDEASGRSVNVGVSLEDETTKVVVNFSHTTR